MSNPDSHQFSRPLRGLKRPGSSVRDSSRLRVLHLLWETSPGLAIAVGAFVLADGLLPNLALVTIGLAVGRVPAAVTDGLGSPAGTALLWALAVGASAYALSLVRRPVQDLLEAHCSTTMATAMRRRLAAAVCEPAGVEHLEEPAILDRLASATGELSTTQPADAPMTLAGIAGDRLAGLFACVVLATFRWWLGVIFFVGWTVLRPPLRRQLAARATNFRRATPELRHSWYFLGCAWRVPFAKELRIFGLSDWILARHEERWRVGMREPWQAMRRFQFRAALFALVVAGMFLVGAGTLAYAAYHHEVGLSTVAVMLPLMPVTMQVGGVSYADVVLEQMLAAVPDLDGIVAALGAPGRVEIGAERAPSSTETPGLALLHAPREAIRFEGVGYRYPTADEPALSGLDLHLPAGSSLGLVGLNGAGKTTLVTLLARLRDPTEGCVTIDGIDLRRLDARGWQRQVAVVYQDFARFPFTARDNVALRDLEAGVDEDALAWAAEQAGAVDLVASLPRGWDTVCSAGYRDGRDLSGGQWQRLALARALYSMARGARVLVLDEPTAQLDVRAEAAFYDRFLDLTAGVTTLVISHRFSTVRRADRIAVLDGGAVSELGTHEQLLTAGGTYAELFKLQAARFEPADDRHDD